MNEPIPDVLVVDHYGDARRNFLEPLFKETRKVLIDDFDTHSHFPYDILINPNTTRSDLAPSMLGRRLLGSSYAPIREEISQLAGTWKAKPPNETQDQCLISIGATDPLNLTSSILRTLSLCSQRQNFRFTVLLSSYAPHIDSVRAKVADVRCLEWDRSHHRNRTHWCCGPLSARQKSGWCLKST